MGTHVLVHVTLNQSERYGYRSAVDPTPEVGPRASPSTPRQSYNADGKPKIPVHVLCSLASGKREVRMHTDRLRPAAPYQLPTQAAVLSVVIGRDGRPEISVGKVTDFVFVSRHSPFLDRVVNA
jgi:hypothetical protein